MPESHPAVKPSLSFAKLVTTPTDSAWSQAYNAGNLFACLSLTLKSTDDPEISLQAIGKDALSLLESEFFILEEKTIATIKKAIIASFAKIPESVTADLTLANFKDNTLSVFIAGSGKAVLKRGETIGTLLEKHDLYDGTVTSASGYVTNADTLVLQSGAFAKGIPPATVASALELALPNDIVEALSPQMHEQDNGAQAAIVISFRGPSSHKVAEESVEPALPEPPEEPTLASLYSPEIEEEFEKRDHEEPSEQIPSSRQSKIHMPKMPHFNLNLNHKRKLFLTIAIILLVLLVTSIGLAVKKQHDEKQQQLFQAIYNPSEQQYEEGQSLESLNKNKSRENYLKAEKTLKDGEPKLSQDSPEQKKVQDLLAKVESALQNTPSGSPISAKETTAPAHSLLAVEKDIPNGLAYGQDATSVYVLSDKDITSVSKKSGTKKVVIKNDSSWSAPVAIVPYQGNLYVLDPKKGVLKFVAASGSYTKSSYFTSNAPDLSLATGMAIDGSVWIVTKDGKILKYTRGKQDSFTLSGMTKPLNTPTKIVTDIAVTNVSILDTGNSRIVQVDKKGTFQKEYAAAEVSQAKDFEVFEKEKKILLQNNGKVYQIDL